MITISKILSANDTSETGAHQAGILIPKEPSILDFFPQLPKAEKNPRAHIMFEDQSGKNWELAFIYYNNRQFGGTRNEYRLTRMTKYIRDANLISGDEVIFIQEQGKYSISYKRKGNITTGSGVLILGSGWKVIQV